MRFSRRKFLGTTIASAGLAATPRFGLAQAYPSQQLKWIIYQSPGGLIDTSSRTLQPYLAEQGFNSVFEYVRGASGRIARTQLYRAKPDGYSIMTEALPEEILGEVVYKADYKVKEFQPVAGWFVNAFNLYVRKDSKLGSLDDFIKAARSQRLTVGTIGKGGPSHLQVMLLRSRLNLQLQPVHFNGGAPAYAALAGGHVDVAIGGSSTARQADTVNFLAVFREGRDPALPAVPTVEELGHKIPNINEVIYINTGPGVPAERLQRLVQAFTKAIENPEHIEKQKKVGVFPKLITASELKGIIASRYGMVTEYKSELEG
ncbi:MAG TPA: tripartite tricarboxylate transporter substrate binding protein [Burkholderiales bacterium]|jgi:tripartite-type tricarboxylate transporter receptor subunit TctC|nr:tripartite tricarboxylate transporter substrate binding protein [Burkholderiales bacterium]